MPLHIWVTTQQSLRQRRDGDADVDEHVFVMSAYELLTLDLRGSMCDVCVALSCVLPSVFGARVWQQVTSACAHMLVPSAHRDLKRQAFATDLLTNVDVPPEFHNKCVYMRNCANACACAVPYHLARCCSDLQGP